MKFKIIGSVLVLVFIIIIAAVKFGSHSQPVNDDGSAVTVENQ